MNLDQNIKPNFKVPDNYFDNFEENLMQKIETDNFTQNKINSGFKTPENYFENFESSVNLSLKETKVFTLQNNLYKVIAIAAVFLISIVSPIFYNHPSNLPTETEMAFLETNLTDCNEHELASLLTNEDFEELENELIYNNL